MKKKLPQKLSVKTISKSWYSSQPTRKLSEAEFRILAQPEPSSIEHFTPPDMRPPKSMIKS
jgi:hypothetical protein